MKDNGRPLRDDGSTSITSTSITYSPWSVWYIYICILYMILNQCQILISSVQIIRKPHQCQALNPKLNVFFSDASLLRRCFNRDQQPPEYSNCLTTFQCCATGSSLDRWDAVEEWFLLMFTLQYSNIAINIGKMGPFWKCTLPQTSHTSWFFRGKYWVYVSIQAAGHAAVVPRWNNSGKVPCRWMMVRRPAGWKKREVGMESGREVLLRFGISCNLMLKLFKLTSYFDSGIDVLSCFLVVQSNFIEI